MSDWNNLTLNSSAGDWKKLTANSTIILHLIIDDCNNSQSSRPTDIIFVNYISQDHRQNYWWCLPGILNELANLVFVGLEVQALTGKAVPEVLTVLPRNSEFSTW